jgi:hypothetical protein
VNSMWTWTILLLLGAYHGLNPAMGWLFAVALGLQERNGKAVLQSLMPLGAGHLLSVAAVVGVVQALQLTLPLGTVRVLCAVALIGFGLYRLVRRRHPRWVGMRVSSRDLVLWSFLMASAHGAGLMLLPFIIGHPQDAMAGSHLHHHAMLVSESATAFTTSTQWWMPVGLHTTGYLLVTAVLALVIYYRVGIAILRRAWFNLELLWVGALLTMGVLTLAM